MALDTAEELQNVHGVATAGIEVIALVPDGVLDEDDLINWNGFSIEPGYDETPEAPEAEFGFDVDPFRLLANFFDQSTNEPTEWLWDFGDPASSTDNTSTEQNPIHGFTAYGTYTVRLTATNAQGSDSVEHEVTITDPGMPYIPINHHVEQGRALLIEQFRIRGPLP